MTEILEGRGAAGRGTPSDPDGGEDRLAEPIDQVGAPFFADLVRAHYAWEREIRTGQGSNGGRVDQLGAAYVEKLGEFRDREGEIVEAYWCVRRPSAVALTEKPQTPLQHFLGEHQMRLHRVSNWLMPRTAEKVVGVLHECDELAIRAGEILRGTPRRITLRSVYEGEREVLAFLERTAGRPSETEVNEFVTDAQEGIEHAWMCYRDAADKVARLVYVSGMLAGIAALLPIAALAGLAIWLFGALHLHSQGTQAFFACLAAGALGALVSVLSRMASPDKFGLDPAVGRRALFILGSYRPLVGSIFGLVLYFLLQSSLLQVEPGKEFGTFVVAAFLGGFSERFVKVMLHTAEESMGGAPKGREANMSEPGGG